ncbi:hypothetical protein LINGRAHAP2_LOCUS20826 [Linum grandiflorum]
MKCKQHPCDLSSSVGVCASCLRHRLLVLVAAQSQLHHQSSSSPCLPRSHSRPSSNSEPPRKFESQNLASLAAPQHPPLLFPRSVSPYVTRRKSHGHRRDDDDVDGDGVDDSWSHHHLRFLTTPQLGPTYSSSSTASSCQRKYAKLSQLANFFRSRSDKLRNPDLVPASSVRDSAQPSSSSWFSSIFHRLRKNKHQSVPEPLPRRRRGRGMSPADFEECDPPSLPGNCDDPWESSKRTPTSARRGKTRNMSNSGNSNPAAGFAFCLSPLVRASPNPHWNQKGTLPPDLGEVRVAVKPNLSTAASYCANRSRKLADIGRR